MKQYDTKTTVIFNRLYVLCKRLYILAYNNNVFNRQTGIINNSQIILVINGIWDR